MARPVIVVAVAVLIEPGSHTLQPPQEGLEVQVLGVAVQARYRMWLSVMAAPLIAGADHDTAKRWCSPSTDGAPGASGGLVLGVAPGEGVPFEDSDHALSPAL